MSFYLNADDLESELSAIERQRVSDANASLMTLRRTDVLGQTGLSASVAGSQREIAAMAMARARGEGPSVAGAATRNAMMGLGPAQGTGSAAGDLAAIRQSGSQQMSLAARGAEARAQESMQQNQMGMNIQAVDRGVLAARQQRQQQLALQIASIVSNNQTQDLRRRAQRRNAELGIDTQQYMTDIQNRDQSARTIVGGVLTTAGTAAAAYKPGPATATPGTPQSGRSSSIRTNTPNTVPGTL
jgi:hypothetical protein